PKWLGTVRAWHRDGCRSRTPWSVDSTIRQAVADSYARQVIRERPDVIRAELLLDPATARRFALDILRALPGSEESSPLRPWAIKIGLPDGREIMVEEVT